MKKKLLSFILAFLLCVSLIPAALADSDKSIVYDREGLFDEFDTEIISATESMVLMSQLSRLPRSTARQPRNTPTIFMTKTKSAKVKTRTAYFFL